MLRAKFILCSMAFSLIATAQDEGPRNGHHEITDEQHNCLTKALGEPGAGERPTKEKAEAAFKSCGMDAPKGPPPGERHHPELNAEQKNCLTKALGEPGAGERPTKEKAEAAFKSCGMVAPKGPPPGERHHPELNAEQKNCLSKALGAPVPGQRPSKEKMQAALKSCGVEFPKGPK